MQIKRETPKTVIESKDCIVCYLDILGYKDLLKKKFSEETYKILLSCISAKDDVNKCDLEPIINKCRIQVLSDSILFILDLEDLPEIHPDLNASNEYKCIAVFLQLVSLFSLDLMSELNYFLRGCVTRGEYCQQEFNKPENQFIFSKALVTAVELERKADTPRILISDHLHRYIMTKKGTVSYEPFRIARAEDGLYYLDPYFKLEGNPRRKSILEGMVKGLKFQMEENKDNVRVLRKYYWFQQYHNSKVKEIGDNWDIEAWEKFLVTTPDYLL